MMDKNNDGDLFLTPDNKSDAHFFDEAAVRSAKHAVPLDASARDRDFRYYWVPIAIIAGLIGGLGASLLAMHFANRTIASPSSRLAQISPTPAQARQNLSSSAGLSNQSDSPTAATRVTTGVSQGAPPELPGAGSRPSPESNRPVRRNTINTSSADGGLAGDLATDMQLQNETALLRGALNDWLAATNARDIQKQASLYNDHIGRFYLARGVSRDEVKVEKARTFAQATTVNVTAGTPDIQLAPDGRTARMRFRKRYVIEGGSQDRRGSVLQELQWTRTPNGWRISGERDLRVLD